MNPLRNGKQAPERGAPAKAGEMDATPVEFQPESGALAPCEAIAEAERERDPREDL